jgi:hypothetical protein
MAEAFKNGGWGMIPTALFGIMLVLAAARYAMSPEKRLVPLQVTLGVLTLASGGLGFVTGLIKSLQYMAQMPDDKRWIWLVGMGESMNNLALAFGLIALAAIAASIGALRVSRTAAA